MQYLSIFIKNYRPAYWRYFDILIEILTRNIAQTLQYVDERLCIIENYNFICLQSHPGNKTIAQSHV